MMRLMFLAAASSIALTGAASAADLYVAGGQKDVADIPPAIWTGFYAGINGGYAFDALGSHGGVVDEGGFGGFQLGYNWQGVLGLGPNVVLGAEADFEAAGIDHTGSDSIHWSDGTVSPATHHRALNEFGTVRGRIGYSFDRTLVYFTGGFAYGSLLNSFDVATGLHTGLYKSQAIETGYVLGGGIEHKLTPAWSVKAEYQFIDLGHSDATDGLANKIHTKDTALDTIRVGLNYRFGADGLLPVSESAGGYKDGGIPYAIWSGFYIGANGGYAWGTSVELSSTVASCVPRAGCGATTVAGKTGPADGNFGGAQAGYNWQQGRFVYGFEADIQAADLKDSLSVRAGSVNTRVSVSLDWFGTARGRLGLAIADQALVYVTGGFAYGGAEQELTAWPRVSLREKQNSIATGYVLGAGVEYAFGPQWSLKAEYQYLDLGTAALSSPGLIGGGPRGASVSAAEEVRNSFNTVRLGLNYHLAPAYEPLK